MADSEDMQTIRMFEPGKGGYRQSAIEQKTVNAAEPATPAAPAPKPPHSVSTRSQSVPVPPKPKSKKTKDKNKKSKKTLPEDAHDHGKLLAESMVNGFVGAIKAHAAQRGGYLLAEDVDALSASFERQTEKLASSLARTMSKFAESHAKKQRGPDRVKAFDRILVNQFAHLLGDDAKAMKNPNIISRRALGGFFSTIRMMCGPERIAQLEKEASRVMQRVQDDLKDEFDWEIVYDDPDTRHMIRDLVVSIAPHFIDLKRRLEWMLGVINGNLAPVAQDAVGLEWHLSHQGLLLLVNALFSEVTTMLDNDMGRLRITKRYGAETLDMLLDVTGGF